MFYYLAELLTPHFTVFNVVSYQTFRAVMSLLTALVFTLMIGPKTIEELRKFHLGQVVRTCGPETHLKKDGTPTMGGVMILSSVLLAILLWCDLRNYYVWIVLFTIVSFGAIGFADDYLMTRAASSPAGSSSGSRQPRSSSASGSTSPPTPRSRPSWSSPSSRTSCPGSACSLSRSSTA